MSQSPAGIESGRRVYQDLLARAKPTATSTLRGWRAIPHYYMANIFNTSYLRSNGGVLPGWIIEQRAPCANPLPPNAKRRLPPRRRTSTGIS